MSCKRKGNRKNGKKIIVIFFFYSTSKNKEWNLKYFWNRLPSGYFTVYYDLNLFSDSSIMHWVNNNVKKKLSIYWCKPSVVAKIVAYFTMLHSLMLELKLKINRFLNNNLQDKHLENWGNIIYGLILLPKWHCTTLSLVNNNTMVVDYFVALEKKS